MPYLLSLIFTLLFSFTLQASGNFTRYIQGLNSPALPAPRDVYVYLPPGYENSNERYPVLYMHDGQNLFDPTRGYMGQTWHAEETLNALIQRGKLRPIIVVGIDNTQERNSEYTQNGKGDQYLALVVNLKTKIDSSFRTLKGRKDTAIMGSSLGGLISLYAGVRYPKVFGLIGALSPSVWWDNKSILGLMDRAPLPYRAYADSGTEGGEQPENARLVTDLLQSHGMRLGVDCYFYLHVGAAHNEAAWAARLPLVLQFLFQ